MIQSSSWGIFHLLCSTPPLFQITTDQTGTREMSQQQSKEHFSDDPILGGASSDDASAQADTSDRTLQHQIQSDDLIVQILARLDGPSYSQALQQDARVCCVSLLPKKSDLFT